MSDAAAQRRARQTVINLALSLLATLGLVLAIVLMVPRDDTNRIQRVDYQQIAADAMSSSQSNVVVPDMPKGWWCNRATWNASPVDAVPAFEAGFVGPNNEYIGMVEGFGANPTWLALKLQGTKLTGAQTGSRFGHWDIYTATEKHDPAKDWDYVMVFNWNKDDYIMLYGNATPEQFADMAARTDSKASETVE
ncbi:MAG: DUF4245 family protein [Rhodoluna sp.]|nr:DUF4245 family protein [Rhodoluna sp.]